MMNLYRQIQHKTKLMQDKQEALERIHTVVIPDGMTLESIQQKIEIDYNKLLEKYKDVELFVNTVNDKLLSFQQNYHSSFIELLKTATPDNIVGNVDFQEFAEKCFDFKRFIIDSLYDEEYADQYDDVFFVWETLLAAGLSEDVETLFDIYYPLQLSTQDFLCSFNESLGF